MNKNIIIDAGHGGEDPGINKNGIEEKDMTLSISKYIYEKIKKRGYNVQLTRYDDTTLTDEERINKIFEKYGNNKNIILISNHVDAPEDKIQIIYALRNNNELPRLIYQKLTEIETHVRNPYQLRLPNNKEKDYHHIIRNTGEIESIMIQYGNIKNKEFAKEISKNYKNYAQAVTEAIIIYLEKISKESNKYTTLQELNTKFDKIIPIYNISNKNITIKVNKPTQKNVEETKNKYIKHVVKKGDTLYNLSKLYNTNIRDIMSFNDLTTNLIKIGQEINIPSKTAN